MLERKILWALLWEQWRLSRLELGFRLAFAVGCLVLISVTRNATDDAVLTVLRGILVFLVAFAALFSASWTTDLDSRQVGFCYQLGFTRPIATGWLVLVPLAYSLLLSQLFYFVSAWGTYLLIGLNLPLVGPAAIIACTVCMLIAGAWSPTRIDGRIVGMGLVILVTLGWLAVRDYWRDDPDPVLLSIGKEGYFDLLWYEYLGLWLVSGLSIAWTILAVDQQRHGEPLIPRNVFSWFKRISLTTCPAEEVIRGTCTKNITLPASAHCFRSPVAAQIWYEVRRSKPLCSIAVWLIPTGLFAFLCVNLQWEYAPRAWLGSLLIAPVILQMLAADGVLGITREQGVVRLSPFDATRPLRCDQLIAIKVWVVFAWSITSAFVVALFAGLYLVLSGEYALWWRESAAIANLVGPVGPSWWVIGLVSSTFMFMSSTTLLLAQGLWMSRYPQILMAGTLVFSIHMIIFIWDASHDWAWWWLWQGYGYILPVAIAIGCVVALVMALRAGYLGRAYFATVLGAWLIYVGATIGLVVTAVPPVPIPGIAYLFAGALLLVPLAGAAFAPLALAAHRHG